MRFVKNPFVYIRFVGVFVREKIEKSNSIFSKDAETIGISITLLPPALSVLILVLFLESQWGPLFMSTVSQEQGLIKLSSFPFAIMAYYFIFIRNAAKLQKGHSDYKSQCFVGINAKLLVVSYFMLPLVILGVCMACSI